MTADSSVLVIQHVDCESLGRIESALARRELTPRYSLIHERHIVPQELREAAGLIIMGGPMSVYDEARLPHLRDELRLIESALRLQRPVLGICLGSQLLAHALGSPVYPSGRNEIGWHNVRLNEQGLRDPLFEGSPPEFVGFHWHGDIFDVPDGAESLASSDLAECQAFRWGTSAYGILFHPEVTMETINGMASSFATELEAAGGSTETLCEQARTHLPTLAAVGDSFFSRWARLVQSELASR